MTTTGNDLAVREDTAPALQVPALPNLPDVDSWIRAMASIAKLADQICNTTFVPKGLRGDPASVTAAILTGRELNLPPMAALRHIHVVEGTPSLDAEYKRAKVLSEGHEFDIVEWDNDHCIVSGRRRGSRKPPLVVSYTMKDARIAKLVRGGGNYETRPRNMMLARATTLICAAIFADVTNGLATTELLESGDEDALADAAGAALPLPAAERQRVTAEQARARNPQTVTAVVETVTPNVPPADEQRPPAAAPVPPSGEPAGGTPALATSGQVGMIQAQLERLGVTERPAKLRVVGLIAGRAVESSKELTQDEARKVKDTLEGLGDGAALDLLRAEIEMTGDPRGEAGGVE